MLSPELPQGSTLSSESQTCLPVSELDCVGSSGSVGDYELTLGAVHPETTESLGSQELHLL